MSKTDCCGRCTGGGMIASDKTCPECGGIPFSNSDGHTMVCDHCHGTGKENVPCPDCNGKHHHH